MATSIKSFALISGLLAYLLYSPETAAQEKAAQAIYAGPEHTIVMVQAAMAEGRNVRSFPAPGYQVRIARADGNGRNFKEVGTVSFPGSAAEMEKRLGSLMPEINTQLNVSSAAQAYQKLLTGGPDSLGLLLLYPEVMETFGMAFIDRSRNPESASIYRLEQIRDGKVQNSVTLTVQAGLPVYNERFLADHFLVTDSVAAVSWLSTVAPETLGMPRYARVYRRTGHKGNFEPVQRLLILSAERGDSSRVQFNESVQQGQHLAYFMRMEDFAGNQGPASDTLHTLALSASGLTGIANLQVTDTLDGLLLTWDPLPRQAVYSAIQLLKSRQLGADYVVVDTIPATETAYLDDKVIAASSYYYKVRPLLYHLPGSEPLAFAEANGHKGGGTSRPAAPEGVTAAVTPRGVKVSWNRGDGLSLYGYYVLRGTSLADMEVVSQPVQDTVFLDTTFAPGYAGQLHYAVQVTGLNQEMSDTSSIASISLRQPVILSSPGGIQVRRTPEGIYLQWDNTMLRDDQVEGFVLYRRTAGTDAFAPVANALLRLPFYTDSTAQQTSSYEYAVTSADSWGNQSIFSPLSVVNADQAGSPAPPLDVSVRNLRAGIEISWPEAGADHGMQYIVYRRPAGQSGFSRLGATTPGQPFVDKTVQPDVLYEYAVAASAGKIEGIKSAPAAIRRANDF